MVALFALLAASHIVITELMANPAGASGAHAPEDRNEFVELYNASRHAVDLFEWTLDDGDSRDRLVAWMDSSILNGNPNLRLNQTWLDPGCYAVVLDSEYTSPDSVGGCVRPYLFGDSTLILTTGNTTIGNGLANTDPVVLVSSSAYGFEDTSTFGTPSDSTDSLPCDPGDGVSWERIRFDRPDTIDNWVACLDSAGCTPGSPSSTVSYLDMAVTGLVLDDSALPNVRTNASATVMNIGFVVTDAWHIDAYLDRNCSEQADPGELVWTVPGWSLVPGADSLLVLGFTCPKGKTDLWVRLVCPGDRDTSNNLRRVTIYPGGSDRLLSLDRASFSPDQDGFEDTLTVYYRLATAGGRLSVTVFDLAGRQVQTLCRNITPEDARGFLVWDGRRSDGRPAAVGVYAIWLEYRQDGTTRAEKLPVVLVRK